MGDLDECLVIADGKGRYGGGRLRKKSSSQGRYGRVGGEKKPSVFLFVQATPMSRPISLRPKCLAS